MNLLHGVRKSLLVFAVGLIAVCAIPSLAGAANLFQDLFAYPNGNLTANGGWYAHSGAGAKAIQVSAGAVTLVQSAGSGEDDNHPFTPRDTTAKTYASFTLKVPAGSILGSTNDYFLHFRPAGNDSNNFVARTFIGPPTAGGDYVLGIAAGSLTSTPVSPWPTGLTFGQTYQVVIAYDAVTGTSTLWVNPVSESDPNVSSTSATLTKRQLASIAFRQASPTGATDSQVIDNVGVDTAFPAFPVPGVTPWSAAILAGVLLAAGGVFVFRRRRTLA